MDFPDDETAKREGEASARDLLMERIRARRQVDNERVEVVKVNGEVLAAYRLRDLLN